MARSVQPAANLAPDDRARLLEGAEHLEIDAALFLERSRAGCRIRVDPPVRHLAAHLLIGEVGVEQRIEMPVEQIEEGLAATRRVEVIHRLATRRVGRVRAHGHVEQEPQHPSLAALAQDQVLRGVRLAAIRVRQRPHPEHRLGHRVEQQDVDRHAARDVCEAGADDLATVAGIDGLGPEAADAVLRL
jgi:hypothetical protein